MNQPNPWILFMGGIAMLNVAFMVGGLHAPTWARYAGMAACAALGVAGMAIGLRKGFEKKPERPKFVPRRQREQGAKKDETGKAR